MQMAGSGKEGGKESSTGRAQCCMAVLLNMVDTSLEYPL